MKKLYLCDSVLHLILYLKGCLNFYFLCRRWQWVAFSGPFLNSPLTTSYSGAPLFPYILWRFQQTYWIRSSRYLSKSWLHTCWLACILFRARVEILPESPHPYLLWDPFPAERLVYFPGDKTKLNFSRLVKTVTMHGDLPPHPYNLPFWCFGTMLNILITSWFQTFALFWMLYAFLWVIPWRLNFICRRFVTLCSIFISG